MSHLSHRDYERVISALGELYEEIDSTELPRTIVRVLTRVTGADCASYNEVDFKTNRIVPACEPDLGDIGAFTEPLMALRHEHPNFDFHERLGKRNAVKISDFMTNRQWQRTGIYNEVYRHLGEGTRYQLSSFVPNFMEPNIGIALCNWRRDFGERERLIMDLMIPHVGRAHINARKWTELNRKKPLAGGAPLRSFGLTPRETEVLQWIVQGKTNAEIAIIVKASARTIDKHVERILTKLRVENRASAIRIALEGI